VVDDIIATGSTMSEAVDVLQQRNVGRVFVTCVHPLLARNAVTKLSRAGVEAIGGTDTIERGVSTVSVAPTLAKTPVSKRLSSPRPVTWLLARGTRLCSATRDAADTELH